MCLCFLSFWTIMQKSSRSAPVKIKSMRAASNPRARVHSCTSNHLPSALINNSQIKERMKEKKKNVEPRENLRGRHKAKGSSKKKTRWLRGENRGNKDGETKAGAVSGREIGGAAAATAPCSVFCHSSKNSSSNHSRTKKKKTHSTVCAAAESEMEDSRNRSGHNG